MILKNTLKFINDNNLIENNDKVLIGLSGGADSVCLTHILYSLRDVLGIELFAAHINHGIRGEEAKRDEDFVNAFAKSLDIPCFILHADIKSTAKELGISEELCGRKARYEFFDKISKENGITKIATAHNKNDMAETVLMNFIRGSSIQGLCGIPVKRDNIIRPVLSLSRDEIISYIKDNGLAYVTDSTNLEDIYTRNKIRHNLIPQICSEYNSGFVETVSKNCENIRLDSEYIEYMTYSEFEKCVTDGIADIELLKNQHPAIRRRIIYKLLVSCTGTEDISSLYVDLIDGLINSQSGKHIDLPKNTEAVIEYGKLIVRPKKEELKDFEYILKSGEETYIREIEKKVTVYCDKAEITVRNRRDGDYFYPVGMDGKKKIKDYFTDKKIPRDKRGSIGIITLNGDIACVIGYRRDRRYNDINIIIK